jgi:hypothetical protein
VRVAQEFLALAYTIDQSFIGSRSILWQWTGTWQSLSEVTLAPGYNGRPILWQSLSPLRVDHTWRLLCTLQVAQCGDSGPRLWSLILWLRQLQHSHYTWQSLSAVTDETPKLQQNGSSDCVLGVHGVRQSQVTRASCSFVRV